MPPPKPPKVLFSYTGPSFSFSEEADHFSFRMRERSLGAAALEVDIPAWALLNVDLSFNEEGGAFLEIEGHFESFGPATRRSIGPLGDTEAFEALRVLSTRLPFPRAPAVRASETLSKVARHELVITEGALRPSHIEGPNFGDVRVRVPSQAVPLEMGRRYRIIGHLTPASPPPSNMGYVVGYGGAYLDALSAEEIRSPDAQTTGEDGEADNQSEILANYFAFHGIRHLRGMRALWRLCHDEIRNRQWLSTAHPDHWGWMNAPVAVVHPGCWRREGRLLERFLGVSTEEANQLTLGERSIERDPHDSQKEELVAGPAVRLLLSKPVAEDAPSERIALAELFDVHRRSPMWMAPYGFPIPPRRYRSAAAESTADKLLEQAGRIEKGIRLKVPAAILRNDTMLIQRTLNTLWTLTVKQLVERYPQMGRDAANPGPAMLEAQRRLQARVSRTIGSNGRYDVDLSRRRVTWIDASGAPRLTATARVIGTWSSGTGELLGGWANPALPRGCAIEPFGPGGTVQTSENDAFSWAMRVGHAVGSDFVFRSVSAGPIGTALHLFLALWGITDI
jgi:hypothetical protein